MYTFEPYKAGDGYRWRLVAENGKIVADGSEAYTSASNVKRAIEGVSEELGISSVDRHEFIIMRREHFDAVKARADTVPERTLIQMLEDAEI